MEHSRRDFLKFLATLPLANRAEIGPTPALAPVIRSGDPRIPTVAITIDDGWNLEMVRRMLTVLKDKGAPATFFIVGWVLERNPELVREALNSGIIEFANHSYTHNNLARLSRSAILREIDTAQGALDTIAGRSTPMKFFRPPYGDGVEWVRQVVFERDLTVVVWSVDGNGARMNGCGCIGSQDVLQTILNTTTNGSIILLHFIDVDAGALPAVIDNLRVRGLQFVTLSELLAPLSIATQPIPPRFDR